MILAGAGVGGGSLNYANTLYVPPEPFFNDQQWRHITDWRSRADAALPAGAADAGRGREPDVHRRRPDRQRGRRRDGVRRHLRPDPGRGVLRPRRNQDARKDGAGPVLRRRRPRPHRLPGVRLLHDGLPLRRQEHPAQELSRPRGICWGASASDDDGEEFRAALRRTVGGPHRSHRKLAAPGQAHVHRQPPDPGRGHLGHAASAVQDAGYRQAAAAFETAGRADPDQLGIDRRCRTVEGLTRPGLDARGGDHLVDSPDGGYPRRTRPVRQGLQRDGAAADPDDRRPRPAGHRCAALEAAARHRRRGSAQACCGCSIPVSGANAR